MIVHHAKDYSYGDREIDLDHHFEIKRVLELQESMQIDDPTRLSEYKSVFRCKQNKL